MRNNWHWILAVVCGCASLLAVAWVDSPKTGLEGYAGSRSCAGCHEEIHAAWQGSQHSKMMRRVSEPGAVVAPLFESEEALPFDPSEAVWVIGSKWEQQFMGAGEDGETLLPGTWHVDAHEWDFRGWDGWERPVPLERCHGCHTVGLDVKTGEFAEPSIGCESCHGPAEWHARTFGLGGVHTSSSADICGQCHTRGNDPTGKYFFPVGYVPGVTWR